jgi:arsenate reductase
MKEAPVNKDFKRRVLFVCTHNAARSQMAEAFLNEIGEAYFEAESAGLEPTEINRVVVEVMAEVGIDLSNAESKSVFELFKRGEEYNYVITVCDEADERCPIFPGPGRRMSWTFADPGKFQGSHEERSAMTRKVRDEVKARVQDFVREFELKLRSAS